MFAALVMLLSLIKIVKSSRTSSLKSNAALIVVASLSLRIAYAKSRIAFIWAISLLKSTFLKSSAVTAKPLNASTLPSA